VKRDEWANEVERIEEGKKVRKKRNVIKCEKWR
jgi:hypothetical protein